MSDQADTTTPEAPEAQSDVERKEFLSRLNEESSKRKAVEAQRAELEKRLEELESQGQSELERERKAREKYEAEYNKMQQENTAMRHSAWIRSAAAEAGFDDPEDAVAFINPASIESAEQAEKEVKRLAKRKPKLLRETNPAPPIGQVLQNGQRVDPNAQQRDEDAEAFAAQIKAAQANDGWQSIPLQ